MIPLIDEHRGKFTVDGKPSPWGKLYDFHEALATPGRLYGTYHFDLYIVDQYFRCLEDLYRFDNKLPRTLTSENPTADLDIGVIEKLHHTPVRIGLKKFRK